MTPLRQSSICEAISTGFRPDDVVEAFRRDGFAVVENLRSDAECDAVVDAVRGLDDLEGEDFRQLHQVHRRSEVVLDAMRNPGVVERVERLVGSEAAAIQSVFFFGCPGTQGFTPHQDNIFVRTNPDRFVLTWSAFVDAGPHNGGLVVYPGTHREPLLEQDRIDRGITEGRVDPNLFTVRVPAQYEAVEISVPRGAVVFMHGHLVHGSLPNRSRAYRYAMFASYVRRGERFLRGNKARRVEIALR